MVQGRDRRVELGYQLAVNCRKKITYPLKNKNSKFNHQQVLFHISTETTILQ